MRPVNLFLTEDGVLKMGYYGLFTQAERYSIKGMKCEGVRSFAPEVFEGEYKMKSDVWSLGIALIGMLGVTPYVGYENDRLPTLDGCYDLPFEEEDVKSEELDEFLQKCFEMEMDGRWSVSELMDVSVMKWRMMSSIPLLWSLK